MNAIGLIMSIIYFLLLLFLIIVLLKDTDKKYYVKAKMLVSSAFLGMAFYFSVFGSDYAELRSFLLAGLIACWCGDLALGYYHKKKRKPYILVGVGLFAVAQAMFLLYLYGVDSDVRTVDIVVPLCAIPTVILLIHGFNLHMGHARYPVVIYSVLLTGVATKAVHMMLDYTTGYAFLTGAAAQLFWFSDYVLLFLYFYHAKKHMTKPILHAANLILYYGAVYLYVVSILY